MAAARTQERQTPQMNKDWAVPEGDSGSLLGSDPPTNERQPEVAELIRQHNDALVKYVYRLVHSRADARDIVQEAYCRFFRLGDPSILSHFRRYLFKTAKHVAIDWIREQVLRDSFLREEPLRAACDAPSLEQVWEAKEDLEAFLQAVERLPPKAKLAIVMFLEDGRSYEEVAIKLGIKTHSARRLVERAMDFLVDAIAQETPPVAGGRQ